MEGGRGEDRLLERERGEIGGGGEKRGPRLEGGIREDMLEGEGEIRGGGEMEG